MTPKLEEIRKLAEFKLDGANIDGRQLARYTLNLVAALEKCREQRDKMLGFYSPRQTTEFEFIVNDFNTELAAILEQK